MEDAQRIAESLLEGFDRHYPHMFVYLREREEMKRMYLRGDQLWTVTTTIPQRPAAATRSTSR